MISWVKDELNEWGWVIWKRCKANGWPRRSIFYTIQELGRAGPVTGGERAVVPPGTFLKKSIQATHIIVQDMPYDLRTVVYAKYVVKCWPVNDTNRCMALGISKDRFYRCLDNAHHYYQGKIPKRLALGVKMANNSGI